MQRQSTVRQIGWGVAALIVTGMVGTARAQESTSAPPARRLVDAMASQHLTAIAAVDPEHEGAYVAAMLFPGVQLLVVTGRPLDSYAAKTQFEHGDYGGLYATLHQAVDPASKTFAQDLNADGLMLKAKDAVDIVYEQVANQFIFDGDPAKRHLSEREYEAQFKTEDARYRRLLEVLVGALKAASASTVS